jgi:large subunit ribosomal protein L17
MRHLKRTAKLGRTGEHRNAMLANLVCSLITHKRVTTTLAKAKAARSVAEKMVTLGKQGTVHARRLVQARLRYQPKRMLPSKEERVEARKEDVIRVLFEEIAPSFKDRSGGYSRIIKLNQRQGDSAEVAILEWVDLTVAPTTQSATTNPPAPEAGK